MKLSPRQLEILNSLAKQPSVQRSREDFGDWQALEDQGLITRASVNISEMLCAITEKGRAQLADQ